MTAAERTIDGVLAEVAARPDCEWGCDELLEALVAEIKRLRSALSGADS